MTQTPQPPPVINNHHGPVPEGLDPALAYNVRPDEVPGVTCGGVHDGDGCDCPPTERIADRLVAAYTKGVKDGAEGVAALNAARPLVDTEALARVRALATQLEADARTGEYRGGSYAGAVLVDVAQRIRLALKGTP